MQGYYLRQFRQDCLLRFLPGNQWRCWVFSYNTVENIRTMFNVSSHMVYYWINNKYITARKTPTNILLVKITPEDKTQLMEKINKSYMAKYMINADCIINWSTKWYKYVKELQGLVEKTGITWSTLNFYKAASSGQIWIFLNIK